MGKSGPDTITGEELDDLRTEITDLKDHIRVLIDAIDEVREELSWLTRNGLPAREPPPPVPVLKQMAADPCADDWGERLVIERGEASPPDPPPAATPPAASDTPSPPRRPGQLF